MKPANPRIVTINGGSSSIKFALFEAGSSLQQILEGDIERIGLPDAALRVKGLNQADNFSRLVAQMVTRSCHLGHCLRNTSRISPLTREKWPDIQNDPVDNRFRPIFPGQF